MSNEARKSGDTGESAVCGYLCHHGYVILARNYRIRGGEIDIIAERDGVAAFVECKARSDSSGASEVTRAQKKRIVAAAAEYFFRTGCTLQPRFDIAEIILGKGGEVLRVNYIENAYDATDMNIFF